MAIGDKVMIGGWEYVEIANPQALYADASATPPICYTLTPESIAKINGLKYKIHVQHAEGWDD